MMRLFTYLLISVIFISCSSNNRTKNIKLGDFTVDAPFGWNKIELKGIDSYVGALTNGIDTLIFDYGWYSYDLSNENSNNHLYSIDTINGKIATLIKPKIMGKGTIGLYISNAYEDNHFNLIGSNIINEQPVFNILKSIKFADSDTSINSELFASKFKQRDYTPSSQKIFKINCAVCHSVSENNLTGPGLESMDKITFDRWFFDPAFVKKTDSTNMNMGPKFHRNMLGYLTVEEILLVKSLVKEN